MFTLPLKANKTYRVHSFSYVFNFEIRLEHRSIIKVLIFFIHNFLYTLFAFSYKVQYLELLNVFIVQKAYLFGVI